MDKDREIRQAMIAILTAGNVGEVETEKERDQLIAGAIGDGVFKQPVISLSVPTRPDGTPDMQALAEDAARQAAEPVMHQAGVAMSYLLSLFKSLADEFTAASPSFDVSGVAAAAGTRRGCRRRGSRVTGWRLSRDTRMGQECIAVAAWYGIQGNDGDVAGLPCLTVDLVGIGTGTSDYPLSTWGDHGEW